MQPHQCLVFGPFRLDLRDERLWCGHEALPLSPKTFVVLHCLVTQAGQLVTKEALLAAVWPDAVVSESSLTVAMRTLRRVLGDEARTPRFIETVHGRGYRFIAPVSSTMPPAQPVTMGRLRRPLPSVVSDPPCFVGRDADLAHLAQWWTTVRQGQRQVGMIIGEPGIGKTALVEAFVAQVRATEDVWVGHGQCLDYYGAGEAYLPVLEALGRLAREPQGASLVAVLRQYAPSWLVHLPALLAPEDHERLAPMASGVTPARMLRELAEALEVLTATRPLVLVLEDLHWSDHATLEWLAYVVRRRDPARLLILGTYRPVEVIVHAHALHAIVTELRHHPQYAELALDYLSAAAVAAYLRQRCGAQPIPSALPQLVHQRTGGNPLFLVAMVDELGRQGLLETAGDPGRHQGALAVLSEIIPLSLRQYIEQHLAQLPEADQALLEAASVAGSTFAVAAVAAGVAEAPATLEARYTAMARQGRFIRDAGIETWPDGTVTACYQFIHALYHEVVYARVSAGHRVRLHQQIGGRKVTGYGAQTRQIAAELAVHFTRGHDAWRAAQYLQYAAEQALQRSAYQEAITHLTTGLEHLQPLPDTPERAQRELAMQLALGSALIVVKGWAAAEVERVFTRAHALCAQEGDTRQRFRALNGLHAWHLVRSDLQAARALGEEALRFAQRVQHPQALLWAHFMLGETMFYLGEFPAARDHFAQGMALDGSLTRDARPFWLTDPGVACLAWLAQALWVLGCPAQAVQHMDKALARAQGLSQPFTIAYVLDMAAELHQFRQEGPLTQARADALLALSTAHDFAARRAQAMYLRGWALAKQGQGEESIVPICQGIAAWRATGAALGQPYLLALLAEAYSMTGHIAEGLRVLAEALATAHHTGERYYKAELYRLNGELLLRQAVPDETQAEACFQQALDMARRQQAKSLELRAAMSLSHLWQQQGKQAEAHALLAPIYGWFTEGFDTADLQAAKALLEELAG